MRSFESVFGHTPTCAASAPGRVNMLGEHTDYNHGYVLPAAIPQRTTVSLSLAPAGEPFQFYSQELDQLELWDGPGSSVPHGFSCYLAGCILVLAEHRPVIPPLQVHVRSEVPMGAGLSSSAALEVALLRAIRALLSLELDDVTLARLAQRAEVQYAGVSCGILDQLASSLADEAHMLFLDTLTLEQRRVPFPTGSAVLVLDSGVPRRLADSGYNQRRAECEEAARQLGLVSLREVQHEAQLEPLPSLLRARARHVYTENQRVLEAVAGVSAVRFGALMNASHASLRDDYAVSVSALDRLVALLQAQVEVFGARLTGAGFGGACVALVAQGSQRPVARTVCASFAAEGGQARLLVPAER